jgi:hypothetical protein
MIVVAGAALIAPACAGSGSDQATDASEASSGGLSKSADAGSSASPAAGDASTATAAAPEAQPVVAVAREVISTAEMTVVAKDVAKAVDGAERAAAARGGFVFGQEDSANGDDHATLTLKVPPDGFRPLLDDLGGLGEEEHRKVTHR